MRVLLTVERYFPAIGGAERVVQRLAEGLASRSHDVTVITTGRRSTDHVNGVAIQRFPIRGNDATGIRGDTAAVVSFIERLEPELVFTYAAQTWTTDLCAVFLERPRDFRLVMAPCGFSALGVGRYRAYFRSLRERLPRYDALVFHSARYQDWDFAAEAGASRRVVIPNGADEPLPTAPRGSQPLVVTIGSHVRTKGHDDFARAVSLLRCDGAIVAPARTGLDAVRGCHLACLLRARRSNDRLQVIDGRDPLAAPRALAAADVFLFPSRIECAPLVILEAMAAGVPWVSYDVGNVGELAGGVVVSDFSELVESAARLLRRRDSSLGHDGREAWARGHRWVTVVDRYEQLFLGLLSERDTSSSLQA